MYIKFLQKHQVVEESAVAEISVLETLAWKYLEYVPLILGNYKKFEDKYYQIYYFFHFKHAKNLSGNCRIICRKTKI